MNIIFIIVTVSVITVNIGLGIVLFSKFPCHQTMIFFTLMVFVGAFAKLRKASISFVMCVRLSVLPSAWNSSAHTGSIFMKFDIWRVFENLS